LIFHYSLFKRKKSKRERKIKSVVKYYYNDMEKSAVVCMYVSWIHWQGNLGPLSYIYVVIGKSALCCFNSTCTTNNLIIICIQIQYIHIKKKTFDLMHKCSECGGVSINFSDGRPGPLPLDWGVTVFLSSIVCGLCAYLIGLVYICQPKCLICLNSNNYKQFHFNFSLIFYVPSYLTKKSLTILKWLNRVFLIFGSE
jgi:hypothetical protein